MRELFVRGGLPRHHGAMLRYVRLTAAGCLMLMAAALLALWGRSYWHSDGVSCSLAKRSFRFNSREGCLHYVIAVKSTAASTLPGASYGWRANSREISPALGPPAPNKANPLFLLQHRSARDISYLNVPHWLVATALGAAGAALWRGSRQFTLRTMLGMTAVIAILLGMATRQ